LFAGAYGQWPLYTSNQYTYFLPGIALAERGAIEHDWLVNCTNSIPVFTAYVFAVIKWFSPVVFYFAHAALVALYALCLIWLLCRILRLSYSEPTLVLSLVVLTVMHADLFVTGFRAMHIFLPAPIPFVFRYMTEGVAGQPMLRHIHQPSAFGVLLLVSLCAFLAGRRRLAPVIAGLVPWFHAAYFLPAGLLIAAYMLLDVRERRIGQALLTGLVALLVVLPPLLYVLVNFSPTSPEIAAQANNILVHERFSHHADPQTWFGVSTLFQVVVVIIGLGIAWRDRKLFTILMTLFSVGCILTLIQVFTKSDALAMLLPWRIFVLLVPISSALLITTVIHSILSRSKWIGEHKRGVLVACCVLMSLLFLSGVVFTKLQAECKRYPPDLVAYVSNHCSFGDIYLIPVHWEWFRLETRCAVFVDFKSHPYKDNEVLEWYRRLQAAKAFYAAGSSTDRRRKLMELLQQWQVTHIVTHGNLAETIDPSWVLPEAAGSGWRIFKVAPEIITSAQQNAVVTPQ
jgi:hypothetical protein